jgi:hypothetical protein
MIGAIVVTLIVYAIVAAFIGIVNRMLRSDEYWSESNQVKAPRKAVATCQGREAVPAVAVVGRGVA